MTAALFLLTQIDAGTDSCYLADSIMGALLPRLANRS